MQSICLILLLLVELVLGKLDSDALLEWKKGIAKDPLGHVLSSWDGNSLASDGCPQNWYGISCSDGRVISITLNDLGLVGSFQFPALIGLQMLRNLSISNNQFTGIILEIGSIGSLEILDLSRNSFHGSIPSDLMNLKNLMLLNLSSNNFGGTIPNSFGKLERLKYLDLQSNGFSSDIMGLLVQLRSVVHVDLSNNRFSGSPDVGLGNSSFVSGVQYLNFSHNSLSGELFAHDGMPYFDNLEVFDASHNQLGGHIPSFNFLFSLRIMRLESNLFSGSLPEGPFQESSMILTELDLSLNQLEGDKLELLIKDWTALVFTGSALCSPLGSITSATLKNLNLSSNKLSGSLPAMVGHCAIVDLSNNMLSGNLSRIQSWGNYVEIIHLSSNLLTGTLPNITSQFLRLASFKISNNSLEGGLPLVLGTYPELNVIDISLNQLNGSLPPSLFTSSILTELNLSGNRFTGSISLQSVSDIPSIGSTPNLSLVSLDLSNNSLSGPLSPEISKLRDLVFLDLSNNHFEGSIPDDLPDTLRGFNVSYNNLSGVVPENLRRFPDSAFHPGNSLLNFPHLLSLPKENPAITLRGKHGAHMRPAIRAALIAGFVGGVTVIALLSLLIYYRAHWKDCKGTKNGSNENVGRKGAPQEGSSLPQISALHKNVDSSPASLNFSQNNLLSSEMGSLHEHGSSSSVAKGTAEIGIPDSTKRDKGMSSAKHLFSSSTLSPSNDQHLSENPTILKVCSPDKLAGDLHFFDSSSVFTSEDLSRAPAEVIGRSCHGTSYKATLDSGHVLVVKWLKEGMAKGKKEFAREAKKLGNIKHPNLVSLCGYYWGLKEHEKLVISKYINASCLALYLHETEQRKLPPLLLHERLKVAIDVSCCLNYLHNERAIPHGNLKSTNILLEPPNLNTLLTDYSIHRIMTPAGTAEQVLNAGALGYRPPEFASSSKPCPSLKSDVYAFGVILLEILTGKSAGEIVTGIPGVVDLTDWVRLLAGENRSTECFDRSILVVDRDLPGGLDDMLQLALRCILPAAERPDMRTIFEDLSSIVL
ncbi:hypothetical protein HHK36_011611 [Tetracentron sinense]|uniref:Protein kinase domain-containing protein n=1 Tax=Tetracentron sinense TaxID=13715 RepID=A0A834ZIX7_TETSI|nr:hypothetical protein HHK36_011611 [Tetracentron sinense]